MDRKLSIGDHVVYVDQVGQHHDALVTCVHGNEYAHYGAIVTAPGCNIVFVSGDADKRDPYGQQIERQTSVVHKRNQPAAGFYWCWPDEVGS